MPGGKWQHYILCEALNKMIILFQFAWTKNKQVLYAISKGSLNIKWYDGKHSTYKQSSPQTCMLFCILSMHDFLSFINFRYIPIYISELAGELKEKPGQLAYCHTEQTPHPHSYKHAGI